MSDRLFIFDTTLRDGEQVPGCQLNTVEKIQVAKQLEQLGEHIFACVCWNLTPGRTSVLLRRQQCCVPSSERYVTCCISFSASAFRKLT